MNDKSLFVQAKMESATWKRHPNPAISLHRFYDGLPNKHKLIYEPQCPVPGTHDHEFYHSPMSKACSSNPFGSHALFGDPDHCETPNCREEDSDDLTVRTKISEHAPVFRNGKQVFQYSFSNWGFMHKDQLDFAISYTNKPLIMDSTFGTNNVGFPPTTIQGVDEFNTVQPLACCILSRETRDSLRKFLQAFLTKVRQCLLLHIDQ